MAKSIAKKREKTMRMQLPQELPSEEVVIGPEGDLTGYVKIDEEVTEVLEITPASFFVKSDGKFSDLLPNRWKKKV